MKRQKKGCVWPIKGPSLSWSYGIWICNYPCKQCQLWIRIPHRWGVLDTTICDKVCELVLVAGRWLSAVSSTNKTDCHDITEILLKVALNTLTLTLTLTFKDYQMLKKKIINVSSLWILSRTSMEPTLVFALYRLFSQRFPTLRIYIMFSLYRILFYSGLSWESFAVYMIYTCWQKGNFLLYSCWQTVFFFNFLWQVYVRVIDR